MVSAGRILQVDYAREQRRRRADDIAAWLERDRQARRRHDRQNRGCVLGGSRRPRSVVGNAQAPADVDVIERNAGVSQLLRQADNRSGRRAEGVRC